MERLMAVTTFQKAIDSLKTTECSQKEKLLLFTQISDCIQSSSLRGNVNYLSFVSNAVSILLMFCEDIDSVVRMSAEENLNRIIRFSTPSNVVRIQYDLFQEIKRNGNDRSLRIALNLFGHYAHMIKQRKVKPYALNLLPCILSISQRKEQQLIETLSHFLEKFCKYFQISLTENEVSNLIEYFLKDAISIECSVKRRCSASNVMTLIEYARRPEVMSKHALTLCLDNLVKDFTLNTIVGALGLLRVLLPKILSTNSLELCVVHKVIEVYDMCLHLLTDGNHTIINASLECISVILANSKPQLTNLLINDKLIHMDVLRKKRSLKNQIFRRKLSTSSMEPAKNPLSPDSAVKSKKLSTTNQSITSKELENDESDVSNVLDYVAAHNATFDDKGLLTGSDIELDSLRLNDFELCQSNESLVQLSETNSPAIKKMSTVSQPLKSQKSTDSIGSFFNTLIHPNAELFAASTETVTKFFRGASSCQSSEPQTPNTVEHLQDDLNQTDANMSEISDGSMLSLNSSALGTFDMLNKTDDSIPEIEILNEQEIATIRLETDEMNHEKSDELDHTLDVTTTVHFETIDREILIGSISNQPLIYYTVRLIASKFLLVGIPYKLINDCDVRVSIKNSSLAVIGHCVALCPQTLLLSLQYNGPENLIFDQSDSEESVCSSSEKGSPSKTAKANTEQADQLNIKDDHFGENSKVPNTYFDFFFPLSKSADNVLLSRLNSDNIGGENSRRTQKLIGDLSNLLSKSDIIDSKSSYKGLDMTVDTSQNINENTINSQALIQSMTEDGSLQFVEDILLFWNHVDPVLRANVQLLAGNFLFNVLNECDSIANFIEQLEIASTYRFLNFNVLFHILIKGLSDDIHTVVKQSLVSLEKIFSILLDHRSQWFYKGNACMQPIISHTDDLSIEFCSIASPISLLTEILDKLTLVFENKYWVIQNKYCHFVATINYDALETIFGQDKGQAYKNQFISHIYTMLCDSDARIRNEAAAAILEFNKFQVIHSSKATHKYSGNHLTIEFMAETLSTEVPFLSDNYYGTLTGYHPSTYNEEIDSREMKRMLGKHLFDLTNMLFDLKSNEQLLGATKCLLNTINAFSPIQFVEIWSEYNILDICVELLISNYTTGADLSCQCDMLTISTNLLAAMVLRQMPDPNNQRQAITSSLLGHVMKLLSIFHNVLNNKRPVFIPKGQKADLFANSREQHLLNSHGYFGNDYFYLKIYKILRIIYENYKITINGEIDSKLFSLLKACLRAMALLAEIMEPFSSIESSAFFDEILIYTKTSLIYEPTMSVLCIKHLIRNMFLMSYPNWKLKENLFDFEHMRKMKPFELFECLNEIRCKSPAPLKPNVEITPVHTGSKLINFLASTSTPEKQKPNTNQRNIKLFEPIVIQSLKIFTKSDSELQSYILEMLCQVLQLKVNYCLLDANNIFMEFILKLIESIETGIVRNSHILTPKIVKFLFYLAKQKEKPQMSIPKIINITDNLLANSITKNGSVEALFQLAFEIYFPRDIDNEPINSQQNAKEQNTQKEVVFSMLLKFIDSFEIKKMICMILLKHTNVSKEIHAELAECLLNILSEQKPLVVTLDDCHLIRQMCAQIRPYLIGDKVNTTRLISRLNKRSDFMFDDVAVKSIILECISAAGDVSFVLGCVSNKSEITTAENVCEHIRNDLMTSINYTGFEYNLLFEGNLRNTMEYLQIFGNYLSGIINILTKCKQIAHHFRKYFKTNTTFVENISNFMKNLAKITISSNSLMRANLCSIKIQFSSILFAVVFDLYEPSYFIEIMNGIQSNEERGLYDRCVITELIQTLVSMPLNHVGKEFLLNQYFTEIVFIDSKFILKSAINDEFVELILSKLSGLLCDNISQKDISFLFLDVIESNRNSTILSMKYFLETDALYRDGSAISRRSFTILKDKLENVSGTASSQIDLVSYLKIFKTKFRFHQMYNFVAKSIEEILTENLEKVPAAIDANKTVPINEEWFHKKTIDVIKSNINKRRIFQILSEVKIEQKLNKMFEDSCDDFDVNLLPIMIECSFENMITKFKHDCFQFNAHVNYLKVSPILKKTLNILCNKIHAIVTTLDQNIENPDTSKNAIDNRARLELNEVMASISVLLKCVSKLQQQCMIYVEVTFINKFLCEQIFRILDFQRLVQLSLVSVNLIEIVQMNGNATYAEDLTLACSCLTHLLRIQAIFNESNYYASAESHSFFDRLLNILYEIVRHNLASESFLEKNQLKAILNERNQINEKKTISDLSYAKAIFLGVFVENCFDFNGKKIPGNNNHLNSFEDNVFSLIIATLRSDSFYFFAVTPREIINSFEWQHNPINKTITFQSVPIDRLNEIEVVEKFLKRINIFGFPLRQHFEEFFMSLLLLINKENDANIVDAQEEYQIKNVCLSDLLELLLSCKMYPKIGDRLNGMFHHIPRLERLTADSISLRKLHGIQNELMTEPSVFYAPNLERCNLQTNNIIGTEEFLHQFELNVIWHIIEGQTPISRSINIELKNMKHFMEASGIDFNSSIQLTFDVITQLLEYNCIQILPHLVKFSELCENRDQFHWIKNTMIKLHEAIPNENAVAHQHIVYCLCKSYAILIPSVHDVNHLCVILGNYLKCSHLFVRVATLKGLLLLLESCVKSNTTIGSLSEEILLLRTFISNYINRYGIIEESSLSYSNEHTVLVWTLNFYVIECTSKFIPDCDMMTNTIISSNNVLRRTTSLTLFSCIIHGLERVVISKTISKYYHEKIEKLALDLVKLENEQFSLLALKLLVTCMYIGSNEQLENTERCNGIVQDEPEVIMQTTEKIEILFQRIKLATSSAAHIYGNVLCQLTNDLVPPKELLTKVIKEFLTVSQPHCDVIAKVVFQVFRSAIDSAYLPLLQDWLLCSLPNFMSFSTQKIMWYLIVIFISASINLSLIKIFPQVLADYHAVFYNDIIDKTTESRPFTQYEEIASECVATRQRSLFTVACKEFYDRLNSDQKHSFRDIFSNLHEPEIYEMLKAL